MMPDLQYKIPITVPRELHGLEFHQPRTEVRGEGLSGRGLDPGPRFGRVQPRPEGQGLPSLDDGNPGNIPTSCRDSFFQWLWEEFGAAGLLGVHEGTLLSEQAVIQGLETESWTVDSAEAPRERDWVGQSDDGRAVLYFASQVAAENASLILKGIPQIQVHQLELQKTEDWDAQWRASFSGVEVPPFWHIVPPWVTESHQRKQMAPQAISQVIEGRETLPFRAGWDPPESRAGVQTPARQTLTPDFSPGLMLKINPGAGFGTGTHETTQLCLEAIGSLGAQGTLGTQSEFPRVSALDFGSGSGILSIALALLGAKVDAVEIDPLAVDNAVENAKLNQVEQLIQWMSSLPESLLDLGRSSHAFNPLKKYSVIVANILRPVLLEYASLLVDHLQPGGHLILSGLIEKDVPSVVDEYSRLLQLAGLLKNPLRDVHVHSKGEWRAIVIHPFSSVGSVSNFNRL